MRCSLQSTLTSPLPPPETVRGGGIELKVPNTLKETMSLPQAAHWKAVADKEIASLKKHGVYDLVPASSVPAGQYVVGSR